MDTGNEITGRVGNGLQYLPKNRHLWNYVEDREYQTNRGKAKAMDEHTLPPLERLTKDLRDAAATLSDREARFLVDAYYIMQEDRKRSGNQIKAMDKSGEPHALLTWFFRQNNMLENQLRFALDRYSETKPIGRWMKSLYAVGPVIAAGVMAHIDINDAETTGQIWRYGGMDPTSKWEKGEKRPWNAELKTLFFKIGATFIFFSKREDKDGNRLCFYGPLFQERKTYEVERNERGYNRERALNEFLPRFSPKTESYGYYKKGLFPPAHVNAMARRWVAKLFISHVHDVWREMEGLPVPRPYILTKDHGHAHEVRPPNWPWRDPGPRWRTQAEINALENPPEDNPPE